jgi:Fe2+ or Zn2+ uptake regulation protein
MTGSEHHPTHVHRVAAHPVHVHAAHDHDRQDVEDRVASMLELLRADGGRVTTGRRAIVQALMTAPDHHVTAEDIALQVQADHPDVHLSTVYRTLDALERLGAVGRLNLGPGPAVYHLRDHAHHHFVCESCGVVIELDNEVVVPWIQALGDRHGVVVSPQQLTVTGRCESCRARELPGDAPAAKTSR